MKMRLLSTAVGLLLIILVTAGCSNGDKAINNQYEQNDAATRDTEEAMMDEKEEISATVFHKAQDNIVLPEIDDITSEWLNAIKNGEDTEKFYKENALLFYEDEKYMQGSKAISGFYNSKVQTFGDMESIYVSYRKQLKENGLMAYETAQITMGNGQVYQYLVIWSKWGDKWLRDLETVALKTESQNDDNGIDSARVKWVELSNKHSAIDLAKELYTEDFVYYNRGVICEGYENLASTYSYMNMPDYSVNLQKDICEPVHPDMTFEIGTYTTPHGEGSYVIIWREKDGLWKIFLDSNW